MSSKTDSNTISSLSGVSASSERIRCLLVSILVIFFLCHCLSQVHTAWLWPFVMDDHSKHRSQIVQWNMVQRLRIELLYDQKRVATDIRQCLMFQNILTERDILSLHLQSLSDISSPKYSINSPTESKQSPATNSTALDFLHYPVEIKHCQHTALASAKHTPSGAWNALR